MLKKLLGATAVVLVMSVGAAYADTTVNLIHVSNSTDAYWKAIADAYNKSHPGVTVNVQYIENEAYKAKLPTLLQSNDLPDLIYSWGGGDMQAHEDAGYLQDISASKNDFLKTVVPSALDAFQTSDGHLVGVPNDFALASLYANKPLLDKAGVDPASLATWDGFVAGIKKLQAAGITPIEVGAADKWPMHFWFAYLLLREGGGGILDDLMKNGFNNPAFIAAGQKLQELVALNPFQDGWQGEKNDPATADFGDGKAALILMGNWLPASEQQGAKDGKGIPNSDLLSLPFPTIPGTKSDGKETLGGINGFEFTKTAKPEAIDFMKFYLSLDQQKGAAEQGLYIPAVIGASDFIKDPLTQQTAKILAASSKHQLYLDQDLGANVGGVVNDVSVGMAAGTIQPADAAKALQDAWNNR